MSALRELLAVFDVKVDHSGLEKFEGQIEGVKGKLEQLAGVFAGAFVGREIKDFVKEQIEAGDALVDLADKLGVGSDELQQFQYSAGIFGVEADSAAKALGFLNKNIGEAIGGNAEAAKTFASLKIQLKDTGGGVREVGDLLPELADAFAEMKSQPERTAKAMAIFGKAGASLLPFLKKGAEGVEELRAEFVDLGGGMTKEFLEGADKAGDEFFRLNFAIKGLKSSLVQAFLPAILDGTKKFTDFTVGLRQFATQTTLVKTSLAGIVLTGIIAAFGLLSAEVLLVGAALVVGYLALDDLYALFTGGDSYIGDFIDSMSGVGASAEFVKDVKDAVHDLGAAFADLAPYLGPLWDGFKITLKWIVQFLLGGMTQALEWIASLMKGIASGLRSLFPKSLTADASPETKAQVGKVTDRLTGSNTGWLNSDDLAVRAAQAGIVNAAAFSGKETIGGASSSLEFGPPVAPGFGAKGGGATSVEQKNQVTVTVQGGANPQETGANVANGVKTAMSSQLQDALGALAAKW